MFVSDALVFVDLHKTGSTHIQSLLAEILEGERLGDHLPLRAEMLQRRRLIVGSIRDPWEWYTSLWAYGCDQKGKLYGTVARAKGLRGRGWRSRPLQTLGDVLTSRRAAELREAYTTADDVDGFKRWLAMLADPRYTPWLDEDYAGFAARHEAGLLTFRYLTLYCATVETRGAVLGLSRRSEIAAFERDHCLVQRFIRAERLEQDLLEALEAAGVSVSPAWRSAIRTAPRSNRSSRRLGVEAYYDRESEAWVADRDRLVAERFGYRRPSERPAIGRTPQRRVRATSRSLP